MFYGNPPYENSFIHRVLKKAIDDFIKAPANQGAGEYDFSFRSAQLAGC